VCSCGEEETGRESADGMDFFYLLFDGLKTAMAFLFLPEKPQTKVESKRARMKIVFRSRPLTNY